MPQNNGAATCQMVKPFWLGLQQTYLTGVNKRYLSYEVAASIFLAKLLTMLISVISLCESLWEASKGDFCEKSALSDQVLPQNNGAVTCLVVKPS